MKEYKFIGVRWSNAKKGPYIDDSIEIWESPVGSEALNMYAAEGWEVKSCWRNDQGLVWIILEREKDNWKR